MQTEPDVQPASPHVATETDLLTIAGAEPLRDDDDDAFSNDPEVIFRREYSKLDTIPLCAAPQPHDEPVPMRVYVLFALIFASFIGGAIIGLITYPTVTITVVPVSRQVSLATPLDLPTRQLAPVTLTRSHSAPATGQGHQHARAATGTLTLYNGLFSPQTLSAGTVFTAEDGIQVVTDETVTVPAGNPPTYGEATVSAQAERPGAAGNIQAGALHATVSNGVFVNNLVSFTGGSDARDFQAVAQTDLTTLISTLRNTLVQQIPQAFPLRSGETVYPTPCQFSATADHGVGDEATTVTVKAAYTCKGIAYNQDELEQQATAALTSQTNPGANYELVNWTPPQVVSVTPLTVRLSGTWVYVLPPDYEQFLAQQIAGQSPEDAHAYLLHTGFVRRATVPAALPKDPGHIHFLILIGGGA